MTRLEKEQHGKPEDETGRLADVKGWLEDDDPFFAAIDEIVRARSKRLPRVYPPRSTNQ